MPKRSARKAASSSSARKPARSPSKQPAVARGDDRLAQLQRLIEVMVEKDVVEVELEESGTRWRVRRKEPQTAMAWQPQPMAMPAPGGGTTAAAPYSAAAPQQAAEPQGEVFKSPMLGTFYRAASPEAEPFVKAGDRVSADTTLCIIEAMKVMNEIKAEREFEVLDVLVKNGEPVEYGQPLFLIR